MKRVLHAVIADDEYHICENLQEILEELGVKIDGIAYDGETVLQLIEQHQPDIAFLDVQMPGSSGIEVAAQLEKQDEGPLVVFITAYDDYALKAYAVSAVDYILKPFDQSDIRRTLKKIERIATKPMALEALPSLPNSNSQPREYPERFCFDRGSRTVIVSAEEVLCAYAENRAVFIQTLGGEILSTKMTLLELEDKLDPRFFFRAHRNYIVNMRQAKELAPGFNRGYLLVLRGTKKIEIPVSRAKINQLTKYVAF